MGLKKIKIGFVSVHDNKVMELISKLDKYQESLYPPESNYLMGPNELDAPDCKLLGAFVDGSLVGIGACKFFDGYGELKRFYVDPASRGDGIATRIAQEIEKLIMLADLPLARLETGIRQVEALSFYKKLGYKERGPYGNYKQDPLSIFMEKIIL